MIQYIAILLTLTFAGVSYADHHACDKKGGCPHSSYKNRGDDPHGRFFLEYSDTLKLSDDQIVKLHKLHQKKYKEKLELKHKLYELDAEMNKAAHESKVDRKKLEKIAAEIGDLKGELTKLRVTSILDAKEILNDAQKKQLREIFSDRYHGGVQEDADGQE